MTFCKRIRVVVASLLIFAQISLSMAADYNFLLKDGKHYLVNKDDPSKPNTLVTVSIIDLGGVGPIVIPPVVVVPPVVPSGDLAAVVKAAIAAVPAYDKKEEDRRVMAYVLNTLSSAVAKAPDAKQAQAGVKLGCDLVVSDKAKWEVFWAAVNTKLNVTSTTPAESYALALKQISEILVDDLPLADSVDEKSGERTYGLDFARIFEIFMKLLPIIEMIIKGLGSVATQ